MIVIRGLLTLFLLIGIVATVLLVLTRHLEPDNKDGYFYAGISGLLSVIIAALLFSSYYFERIAIHGM